MSLKKIIKAMFDKKIKFVFMIGILILVNVWVAMATPDPEGPSSFTVVSEERRTGTSGVQRATYAGNVTKVNIDGKTITQSWAGFVGNVTGGLTLDDTDGDTLYDWDFTQTPGGEVYASTAAVTWTEGNIFCYNLSWTRNETVSIADNANYTKFESSLGIGVDDIDGVNETFSMGTDFDGFFAGLNNISDDRSCAETQTYNGSGAQVATEWQEVILFSNSTDQPVFTTIIENNLDGFDNGIWDFQMIVPEDGHNGDTAATTYYFYIELE